MPKRSNQFQSLILLINNSLAGNSEVKESAMLTDKTTGELREVDVLITSNSSGYVVLIAIECVARGRKADTPWIESMHSKHSSLPTNKLILVSENGFYLTALKKAQFLGIEAITIEKALATDWEAAIQLNGEGFVEKTSFSYSCAMVYEFLDGRKTEVKIYNNSEINDGLQKTSVGAFVHHILNSEDFRDTIKEQVLISNNREFQVNFRRNPKGFWVTKIDGEDAIAAELKIYVFVNHSKTPLEFSTGKYQETNFVTGVSTSSDKLQFVLIKNPDGTNQCSIIDGETILKGAEHKSYKL